MEPGVLRKPLWEDHVLAAVLDISVRSQAEKRFMRNRIFAVHLGHYRVQKVSVRPPNVIYGHDWQIQLFQPVVIERIESQAIIIPVFPIIKLDAVVLKSRSAWSVPAFTPSTPVSHPRVSNFVALAWPDEWMS